MTCIVGTKLGVDEGQKRKKVGKQRGNKGATKAQ